MHNSWLPDSVYGTAAVACLSQPCQAQNVPTSRFAFMMAAPDERKQQKIPLYSAKYFQACTIGGILACGPTHTSVTPLDVVKCNMQIDSKRYSSIGTGFKITLAEGGISNLLRGWAPTFIGYSIQGAGKYGLYEYFKHLYADMAGAKTAANYQTPLFLAASASAEFLADIGLCPLEAVKVKIQTSPGYAKGLTDGLPKFVQENGVAGLWKGLVPLWGRQIPYTMMKFAAFENIVQALYTSVVPKPKSECSKTEQLGVSFAAGYLAGILCAVISHPADNLVSKLNASKEATIGGVISEMGWWQLATRGLGLRIAMIGTLTATQWAIYDSFKVYVGLPTTGAAPPPENEEEHAKKA